MYIQREIEQKIKKSYHKNRAIIIYGARRVGKTTLIKHLMNDYSNTSEFLNCDDPVVRDLLQDKGIADLEKIIGKKTFLFIDEAQRIKNIGITIKLIVDSFPKVQTVVSGSSALDLSNIINEPLTGRKFVFRLYPLSLREISKINSNVDILTRQNIFLITGLYPEIFANPSLSEEYLLEMSGSYLYKDVLAFQDVRHSDVILKLIKAISLQIGREVSNNELAVSLGVSRQTIERYLDLLEKSFVIKQLSAYSTNPRKELSKKKKIIFFDNGIRNALINNFNPVDLRNDIGMLWENFIISERIKNASNSGLLTNFHFWRTMAKQEVDLIEESQNNIHGIEIKWNPKKNPRFPKPFIDSYPTAKRTILTPSNYLKFLL